MYLATNDLITTNQISNVIKTLQDGRINYDEFVAMMRKGNPDPIPKKRRELSFKWTTVEVEEERR